MKANEFKIFSSAFKEGEMIPQKYTGDGININPELKWENPPKETKSFALICDDPDTPMGVIHHWLVKDIPASVHEIPEGGSVGVVLPNIAGVTSYIGPAPPSGIHKYFFKLYAMKTEKLAATNKDELYKEVEIENCGKAALMGMYTREKKEKP